MAEQESFHHQGFAQEAGQEEEADTPGGRSDTPSLVEALVEALAEALAVASDDAWEILNFHTESRRPVGYRRAQQEKP